MALVGCTGFEANLFRPLKCRVCFRPKDKHKAKEEAPVAPVVVVTHAPAPRASLDSPRKVPPPVSPKPTRRDSHLASVPSQTSQPSPSQASQPSPSPPVSSASPNGSAPALVPVVPAPAPAPAPVSVPALAFAPAPAVPLVPLVMLPPLIMLIPSLSETLPKVDGMEQEELDMGVLSPLPTMAPVSGSERFLRRMSGFAPSNTFTLRPVPEDLLGSVLGEKMQKCSDRYDVRLREVLGKGGYGIVFGGSNRSTKKEVAIKAIDKGKLRDEQSKAELRNEVAIMNALKDADFILKLFDVFETEEEIHIIVERCKGDMSGIMDQCKTESDVARLFAQVMSGLLRCQQFGIVHRDIKPENFLVAEDGSLRLSDFGLAVMAKDVFSGDGFYHEDGEAKGTMLFVAPEVFNNKFSFKSDVWSCGVILHLLLAGTFPFVSLGEILSPHPANLDCLRWDGLSPSVIDLVGHMLDKNVDTRYTTEQVFSHEWMTSKHLEKPREDAVIHRLQQYARIGPVKKALMKIVAYNLRPDQIVSVGKIFSDLDKDHSMTITVQELAKAFCDRGVSPNVVEELLRGLDLDGNNVLDYDEFITAAVSHTLLLTEETMRIAFRKFDINGDGKISREEFQAGLGGFQLAAEEIDKFMHQFDADGNHQLDYEEFVSMLVG